MAGSRHRSVGVREFGARRGREGSRNRGSGEKGSAGGGTADRVVKGEAENA